MPSFAPLRALVVSDYTVDLLQTDSAAAHLGNVDLIISCGDLPYYYIESLMQTFQVPAVFVRGNHDPMVEYGVKGQRKQPLGAVDLDGRMLNHDNVLMAGFEGSVWYKDGPFMYTQQEIWGKVLRMVPRLLWNKLAHGRYLDVLVSHSPPWGVYLDVDHVHQGFKAFNWLIRVFKPVYHFHGHIHLPHDRQGEEHRLELTRVINACRYTEALVEPRRRYVKPPRQKRVMRPNLASSLEDFREARRRAAIETVLDTIRGKPADLLSFREVIERLGGGDKTQPRGVQTIPLDAIVGSVGRYADFTRKFLPRQESNLERWVAVRSKYTTAAEMPAIEVYQIGEVYFVLDGNHRVSVARQNGETEIRARVTLVETKAPLTPEDRPDDIIIKAQYAKFLEDTPLGELRPKVDLQVTAAGQYRVLRDHIAAHHYLLEMRRRTSVSFEQAVISWVDTVYLPLVRVIRSQGLLREFPEYTPTDLYLWIVSQQQELAKEIGWEVDASLVARDLVRRYSLRLPRVLQRGWKRALHALRLGELDAGPPLGDWRRAHAIPRQEGRMFSAILVAVGGQQVGRKALEQAALVAKKENGHLRGVHILNKDHQLNDQAFDWMTDTFEEVLKSEDINGDFIIERGRIADRIASLARWNDLVVFELQHPPAEEVASRLQSGVRTLIQKSPRPLLAVPAVSPMEHALLAYDGREKAREALYLATYLAVNWGIQLTVLTADGEAGDQPPALEEARQYLEARQVEAEYLHRPGAAGEAVLQVAEEKGCDFIVMGGYGRRPVFEMMLGSTIDQVLRVYQGPVLICR